MNTIQLKLGHYYRTRDGDIVGPMHLRTGVGVFPWMSPVGDTYRGNGRHGFQGTPSAFDLVEDLGPEDPANPAQTLITPQPGMYMDARVAPEKAVFILVSCVSGIRWSAVLMSDELKYTCMAEVDVDHRRRVRWSDETEWSRVEMPSPIRTLKTVQVRFDCGISADVIATIEDGAVVSVALAGDEP